MLWLLIHLVSQEVDAKALCEGAVSSLGLGSSGLGLRVTPWDVETELERGRAEVALKVKVKDCGETLNQ